jgi:hypothetical protein
MKDKINRVWPSPQLRPTVIVRSKIIMRSQEFVSEEIKSEQQSTKESVSQLLLVEDQNQEKPGVKVEESDESTQSQQESTKAVVTVQQVAPGNYDMIVGKQLRMATSRKSSFEVCNYTNKGICVHFSYSYIEPGKKEKGKAKDLYSIGLQGLMLQQPLSLGQCDFVQANLHDQQDMRDNIRIGFQGPGTKLLVTLKSAADVIMMPHIMLDKQKLMKLLGQNTTYVNNHCIRVHTREGVTN